MPCPRAGLRAADFASRLNPGRNGRSSWRTLATPEVWKVLQHTESERRAEKSFSISMRVARLQRNASRRPNRRPKRHALIEESRRTTASDLIQGVAAPPASTRSLHATLPADKSDGNIERLRLRTPLATAGRFDDQPEGGETGENSVSLRHSMTGKRQAREFGRRSIILYVVDDITCCAGSFRRVSWFRSSLKRQIVTLGEMDGNRCDRCPHRRGPGVGRPRKSENDSDLLANPRVIDSGGKWLGQSSRTDDGIDVVREGVDRRPPADRGGGPLKAISLRIGLVGCCHIKRVHLFDDLFFAAL